MPIKISGVILAAMLFVPVIAYAQPNCGPYNEITGDLKTNFNEKMIGMGVMSSKNITEIWVNYKVGTWTVLLTDSDGRACVKASGMKWVEPVR